MPGGIGWYQGRDFQRWGATTEKALHSMPAHWMDPTGAWQSKVHINDGVEVDLPTAILVSSHLQSYVNASTSNWTLETIEGQCHSLNIGVTGWNLVASPTIQAAAFCTS